jgi:glycosyltransferase involved in cell wall biosynthesis
VATKMRVLWFTNIELPAVRRRLSCPVPSGGGWMESLRSALHSHASVQLGVAATGATPFEPFDEEGVRYFHLDTPPPRSGFRGVAERWHHRLDDDSVLAGASAVVERFEPDLIHVHGSEGPLGLLGDAMHIPLIISLQGLLIVYSRFYFGGLPCSEVARDVLSVKFVKGSGLVHAAWNMRAAAGRETRILKSCRYFAGRTEWDRSVVSVLNPGARYFRAEEVLRPEFYRHEWRAASDGPFVVYTTGGSAPYKGLINLLDAVALLRESVRREIKLRVSGEIQGTSMWPIAQRALKRLRLENATTWLGSLSPVSIASELEGASVYVHPSMIDNSPNALAEAMIVGAPCVASSAGGIPSMIRDGTDGLLYGPNDVYSLAGRIAAIEANPALAARLGSNARARAQRRHDPGAIASATVDMYADVIASHRSGER